MTDKIVSAMKGKGYVVFEQDDKPYNLNIVGVRSENTQSNSFDDKLYVFWWYKGVLNTIVFDITTDPGKYWLLNPTNPNGTAILVEGQYRGVYQIGLHQGRYEALVQRGLVRIYRDRNKDTALDMIDNTIQQGRNFGINIHQAALNGDTVEVDKWSAGCQVFANSFDFEIFMNLCKRSARIFGNRFTYTLLNGKEL
jgi:hypothetical protein